MSAGEWDRAVKRPEELCGACQEQFLAEALVVTCLELTQEGFTRQDYCTVCYDKEPREPFSYWRRALPKDLAAGPRRLDLAFLSEFFRRLEGQEDAHARRVMWIVALLLLRKRILELKSRTVSDNVETLVLAFKNDDREFEVRDPELDQDAMASIEGDLARIFNLDGRRATRTEPATKSKVEPPVPEGGADAESVPT